FEDKDQLVLIAIERAHSGIVLDPDAKVLGLAVKGAAGGQQCVEMAPVHADVVQRAVNTEGREVAEYPAERGDEFRAIYLAGTHRRRAMAHCAKAARATIDRRMIGGGEHHRGALLAQQRSESPSLKGAAAYHAMATQQPVVADLADWRSGRNLGYRVGRIV